VIIPDIGVGISEDEIPNLFQRFYRIESRQSRSHEGTGIGLALVYELIKRHGGDIECTSIVNQGTTFKIWLPTGHDHLPLEKVFFQNDTKGQYMNQDSKLFDSKQLYLEESLQWIQNNKPGFHEENENSDTESFNDVNYIMNMDIDDYGMEENDDRGFLTKNEDNDPIPLSGTKHVVLLADDNSDMRNYLAGLLRKEFTVYCACDGREALRQLKKLKHPPDLILSGKILILLSLLIF
jgi:CheY-like chemotaxis protein